MMAVATGCSAFGLNHPDRDCQGSDLSIRALGGDAVAGSSVYAFELRTRGKQACWTGGFPDVEMLDGRGQPIATEVHRDPAMAPESTPSRFRLVPDARA